MNDITVEIGKVNEKLSTSTECYVAIPLTMKWLKRHAETEVIQIFSDD